MVVYVASFSVQQSWALGPLTILVLQIRKLRHGDILPIDCTASKEQKQRKPYWLYIDPEHAASLAIGCWLREANRGGII